MDYKQVYRESMENAGLSEEDFIEKVGKKDYEKYIKDSTDKKYENPKALNFGAAKYKFLFNEASDYIYQNGGDFDDFLGYLDGCNYSGLDNCTNEELLEAWEVADAVIPRDFAEENRKNYEDEGFYEWDE